MDVGNFLEPAPGLMYQFVYFLPMALLVYPIFGLYICLIVTNKERSMNTDVVVPNLASPGTFFYISIPPILLLEP